MFMMGKEADLVAFSPCRDLTLSSLYAVNSRCANVQRGSVGS
jgi:hypothetical protein